MAIPLDDYEKIFSQPGRPAGGDGGLRLSDADEAALDRAWHRLADERGVKQLPNQPTEAEILAM